MILLLRFLLPFLAANALAQSSPAPPAIAAKSYLLYDYQSNQTLVTNNADERIEPASLTKLMTAYLAFNALKQKTLTLDQVVPVSQHAWKAEGSRTFIEPRMPVTVTSKSSVGIQRSLTRAPRVMSSSSSSPAGLSSV